MINVLFKRAFLLVVSFLFVLLTLPVSVKAQPVEECTEAQLRNLGVAIVSCNATPVCDSSQANNGIETPKWVTSIQPPYSVEDFAVEALRALAVKEGVPETSTVTQEHVLFFVAFTQREGGNITNTSLYNPWNTNYSGSDIKPVVPDGGGAQAYNSFNDGVEVYARVWSGTGGSGGYQSRIGTILSDPASTVNDIARVITYYKDFLGNKAWAGASEEPKTESYFQNLVANVIPSTRAHYASQASLLLGPPGNTARKNLHSPHALRYQFAGDTSTGISGTASASGSSQTTDCVSTGGAVAGNIAQTAVNFSWPSNQGLNKKPEYLAAMKQFNPGIPFGGADAKEGGADCGGFVSTVMRASGADPKYPTAGTSIQEAYVRSHPEKYDIVDSVGSTADLLPGDIMIVNKSGGAGVNGHTYIYVGPQSNKTNTASASFHERMAHLGNAILKDDRGNYIRVRLK